MNYTLKEVVETFGVESQYDIAVEELSELIQAIQKLKRYKDKARKLNLLEELVDVEIMIEQLKLIMSFEDQNILDRYSDMKACKMNRLFNRVRKHKLIISRVDNEIYGK